MCAGLLVSAVSTSLVFQFTVIWGADVDSFGAENVSFCILVASTSGRDPGGLRSTRRETLGSRLELLSNLGGF